MILVRLCLDVFDGIDLILRLLWVIYALVGFYSDINLIWSTCFVGGVFVRLLVWFTY